MSNWRYDQLSLFEEKSPARFVAEIAHPYWTTSAERIIEAVRSGKNAQKVIKEEYCPYGYAGHYGFHEEYDGYTMKPGKIWIIKDGKFEAFSITWADFANEIIDMVKNGEYNDK